MNKRITFSILAVLALTLGGGYAIWQSGLISDVDNNEDHIEDPVQPITEADERERRESEEEARPEPDTSGGQEQEATDSRRNTPPTMTSWNWDSENQVAAIRAYVSDATEGTCKVVFEKSGYSSVTREAPLALQGSTYVCQGFNVERAAFPVGGAWQVRVDFSSDTAQGSSQTQTININ